MEININLSNLKTVVNRSFYPLLTNKDRFLVLRGGAGSGKSHFCAQKILIRDLVGMKQGVKHKFLCLRKTAPAARKSVYTLFREYIDRWNLEDIYKVYTTDMTIANKISKSEIIITGLDDPEKIKSIEGVTSAWLEECNEFHVDDFRQINLRLRGGTKSYKQIMLSFNPVSKNSWLYEEFYGDKRRKEGVSTHLSTYSDNRFLDDDYKKELEELINLDKYAYMVYCKGEWGVLENIVYQNYVLVDSPPEKIVDRWYGLDFGYNHPSCLIQVMKDEDDRIYVHERLYKDKLTNRDLIKWLVANNVETDKRIYCDSAEPDRIREIRRAGFHARKASKGRAAKGKTAKQNSIDFVKRKKLHITKESIELIKEIQGYRYKTTTDGEVLDDPVEYKDHAMDAMRYAIWSHLGAPSRPKARWI